MNDLNDSRFECENEIKPQGDVTSPRWILDTWLPAVPDYSSPLGWRPGQTRCRAQLGRLDMMVQQRRVSGHRGRKSTVDHTLQEIRKFQTSFPLLHLLFFPCQQGDEEQLPMLFGEETPPSWTS